MVLKKLTLVMFAFAALMIAACSEDVVDPDPTGDDYAAYFPDQTGDYWIYSNHDIDIDGTKTDIGNDSTAVTGEIEKDGKTCDIFQSWATDGDGQMTYWMYYDAGAIYLHTTMLNAVIDGISESAGIDLPFKVTEPWAKVADFNGTEWTIHTKDFTDENITIEEYSLNVKLNGTFTVTGKKGGSQNIEVDGAQIPSMEFIVTMKFEGSIKSDLISEKELNFEIPVHTWYGKNVGEVYEIAEPQEIEIKGLPFLGDVTFPIIGTESKCLRYNVQ